MYQRWRGTLEKSNQDDVEEINLHNNKAGHSSKGVVWVFNGATLVLAIMRFVIEELNPITLQYITAHIASSEASAKPWISKSE